jgi:hypothetical protein
MPRKNDPASEIHSNCPTCKKDFVYKRYKPKVYCSKKCSTNSPEVKEKNRTMVAESFMRKYGGHPMAVNDSTKDKLKNTLVQLYGVEHYSQTTDFGVKSKKTRLDRYGSENYNNVDKMKETCLNKYGVDNFRKTDEYKKQYEKTCQKKYGTPHASQTQEYKDSHKKNMFLKFLSSGRFENFVNKFSPDEYLGVTPRFNKKYSFECKRCHGIESHDISNGKSVRCSKCDKTMSNFQTEVVEYIRSMLPTDPIVINNRAILSPQELDIYIPNKNIAIETNGLYWHTEVSGSKNRNYHLNKTKSCISKGIRLIHVLENEWNHKKDIVKSILKSILVKENTCIHARKCEIREIAPTDKRNFLENNHIQGNDHSTIKIGLYHEQTLVSVMTFVKSRFDKKIEWEMSRFCSKMGHTIVGGSSKLFNYFIKTYKPNTVVSYSDRRYFSGETYVKLGFNFNSNTPPNYHYIIDNYDTLQSRINWQKGKLEKKLLSFDKSISEWENMKMNNFDRIWDCGHSKWIYNNKNL